MRFALDDEVHEVERFSFAVIRGDLRHPDGPDPDYSTIALSRHNRLSAFAEGCQLSKTFQAWLQTVRPFVASARMEEDDDSECDEFEFEFDGAHVEFEFSWEEEHQIVEQELLDALYQACETAAFGLRLTPMDVGGPVCRASCADLHAWNHKYTHRQLQTILKGQLRSLCLRNWLPQIVLPFN